MCDCLKISKSGFYDWHGRAPSKRSLANAALLAQIEAAHTMSDATYGMPRIRAELADQGVVASRKRMQRSCGVRRSAVSAAGAATW